MCTRPSSSINRRSSASSAPGVVVVLEPIHGEDPIGPLVGAGREAATIGDPGRRGRLARDLQHALPIVDPDHSSRAVRRQCDRFRAVRAAEVDDDLARDFGSDPPAEEDLQLNPSRVGRRLKGERLSRRVIARPAVAADPPKELISQSPADDSHFRASKTIRRRTDGRAHFRARPQIQGFPDGRTGVLAESRLISRDGRGGGGPSPPWALPRVRRRTSPPARRCAAGSPCS